ncbi:CCR4-NOT transcription complex subunit 6 [Acrasis kona]|uniref:CCR4-NOT transcription complex subunit 6 n=1 Tax=Acrasis kona TaxID=1008807 RepID=A0AAW2YXY0_9EUKA
MDEIDALLNGPPKEKKRGRPKKDDPHPIKPFMGREKIILNAEPTSNPVHSILCYNILCQSYCKSYFFPTSDRKSLSWLYRKERIEKELLSYKADIMCLQEVDKYTNHWRHRLFKAGYSSCYKQRTRAKVDGCAIFYKTHKYYLVYEKPIELNNASIVGDLYDEEYMTDNVGIIAILQLQTQDKKTLTPCFPPSKADQQHVSRRYLCVVNVHLFWNPLYTDIKISQCHYALHQVKSYLNMTLGDEMSKHIPIVLCGDFNSLPNGEVYNLLTTSTTSIPRIIPEKKSTLKQINDIAWRVEHTRINDESGTSHGAVLISNPHGEGYVPGRSNVHFQEGYHEHATFKSELELYSAYHIANESEPPFTNFTSKFQGTLDYVMVGGVQDNPHQMNRTSPELIKIRCMLKTIDEKEAREHDALPSFKYPSDHIAMYCELEALPKQ